MQDVNFQNFPAWFAPRDVDGVTWLYHGEPLARGKEGDLRIELDQDRRLSPIDAVRVFFPEQLSAALVREIDSKDLGWALVPTPLKARLHKWRLAESEIQLVLDILESESGRRSLQKWLLVSERTTKSEFMGLIEASWVNPSFMEDHQEQEISNWTPKKVATLIACFHKKTSQFDLTISEAVKMGRWPKSVSADWRRQGDQAYLNLNIKVSDPIHLRAKMDLVLNETEKIFRKVSETLLEIHGENHG